MHSFAPHIAQRRIIPVETVHAGAAIRARTRRMPPLGNQGGHRLAHGLVATLAQAAPIGRALRLVALRKLATEGGEPLAQCRWSDQNHHRFAFRHPAARASASEQNQRSPAEASMRVAS